MPAAAASQLGGLPLGLAHNVRLKNPVKRGQPVRWADAAVDETALAVRVRRDMEQRFAGNRQAAE
jgi:predicted homoserine dehydrogenase-like protein